MTTSAWKPAALAGAITIACASPGLAADEANCEARIAAKGFPNVIQTVASLSAVKVWAREANRKYGPDYSMWHNAGAASLKCANVKDSEYIMCVAMGRPCHMHLASGQSGEPDSQDR